MRRSDLELAAMGTDGAVRGGQDLAEHLAGAKTPQQDAPPTADEQCAPLTDEQKEAERQDRRRKFEEIKAIAAGVPQDRSDAHS